MVLAALRVLNEPTDAVDKQQAIGQARQWVGDFSFGDVGLRSSHAQRISGSIMNSDPEGKRSEEHTSELQSRGHLVCRLLLEKKKKIIITVHKARNNYETEQMK